VGSNLTFGTAVIWTYDNWNTAFRLNGTQLFNRRNAVFWMDHSVGQIILGQ